MVTIIDKLQRHPTMALSTMQDIGGCRAILESVEEIRRVQRRVVHRRPPIRVDDYITRPPSTGYRAVHLVVRYDDRNIEIQLRTHLMHEWAVAVERLGGRSDIDLKSGEGPLEVLDWLAAVADALAIEDEGRMVDSALVADIDQLRKAAEPYLIRGSRR